MMERFGRIRAPGFGARVAAAALPLALATLLAACGASDGGGAGHASSLAAPTFLAAPMLTPSAAAPLAAALDVSASQNVTVSLVITDTSPSNPDPQATVAYPTLSATHNDLPVLGFKFGHTYSVSVRATNSSGRSTTWPTPLTFGPVSAPPGFPPIVKNVTGVTSAEPGVVLFDVGTNNVGGCATEACTANLGIFLVIVDNNGDVVWYMPHNWAGVHEVHRRANGNLIVNVPDTKIEEVDMLGNVVKTWLSRLDPEYANPPANAIKVNTDAFHHEILELPATVGGNFLALSAQRRTVGYPNAESNGAPTQTSGIVEDHVVEFSPTTGAVAKEWSLSDTGLDNSDPVLKRLNPPLEPTRIGYDSFGTFWNGLYGCNFSSPLTACYDWTHGNGLAYDVANNAILVSLRHHDAVVSFSRSSNAIRWILGNQFYWSGTLAPYLLTPPVGSDNTFWQYHQHAPLVSKTGTVMVFDNGSFRAMPPDAKLPASANNSRAVEYAVTYSPGDFYTPAVRMVTRPWDYTFPVSGDSSTILYAPYISDVDELPTTGNILITFGGINRVPDPPQAAAGCQPACVAGDPSDDIGGPAAGKKTARIVEVTHDTAKTIKFDILIGNNDLTDGRGWTSYRAEKLPSLYP